MRKKFADIITALKPHQQRVVDRMMDPSQPGLVVAHGLGSGKTYSSIAVADALGLPADVVLPAALRANYVKELEGHTDEPPATDIHSIEGTARAGGGNLKHPLLIIDEAHRLRNAGKARTALKESPALKRLALTGSLVYNDPSDMAGPINLVAGKNVLPESPDLFAARYIEQRPNAGYLRRLVSHFTGAPISYSPHITNKGKAALREVVDKYVDYHPSSTEDFPERIDEIVRVPMTGYQQRTYDAVMAELPKQLRMKVLAGLPPTKAEAKTLNAFMSGVRQVANTTAAFSTDRAPDQPKIDRAVEELKRTLDANERAKAVVYSNYIASGIDPYRQKLDALGVPYGAFTGDMSRSERDAMVRDYNKGKLRALLLSSAGGEGLDLKGTRLLQILEPHFNAEKLKQVAGRGIRYRSHAGLPEDERNVRVQRFLSSRTPEGLLESMSLKKPGLTADEYLDEMSQRKERLNDQVRAIMAESMRGKTAAREARLCAPGSVKKTGATSGSAGTITRRTCPRRWPW